MTHSPLSITQEILDDSLLDGSESESESEIKNLCTLCGVDMGPQNPRQLCGKTRCLEKGHWWEQEQYDILRPDMVTKDGKTRLRRDLAVKSLAKFKKQAPRQSSRITSQKIHGPQKQLAKKTPKKTARGTQTPGKSKKAQKRKQGLGNSIKDPIVVSSL